MQPRSVWHCSASFPLVRNRKGLLDDLEAPSPRVQTTQRCVARCSSFAAGNCVDTCIGLLCLGSLYGVLDTVTAVTNASSMECILTGSSRLSLLAYCSNITKAPMAGGDTSRSTLTTHSNPSCSVHTDSPGLPAPWRAGTLRDDIEDYSRWVL
ncbi:hypothetical protein C8Q77DRAFT_829417 [Trametes polyzona]|nr:hypothetical protein C8Q77DRAFT_829417 [Trametes polyzona]